MTTWSTRRLSAAGVGLCTLCVTLARCSDVTGPDPNVNPPTYVQDCQVLRVKNVPLGAGLSLNKPAHCPLTLPSSYYLDYAATITIPQSYVQYGFLTSTIQPAGLSFASSQVFTTTWNQGTDGSGTRVYFIQPSGSYAAATGQFDNYAHTYDDMLHYMMTPYTSAGTSDSVIIGIRIGYFIKPGSPPPPRSDVTTPALVAPGATYSASVITHDPFMQNPITWSWYANGVLVGTTSNPTIQLRAPTTRYASQTIQVTASDAYGETDSGMSTVRTTGGCSGSQIRC